MTRNQIEYSKLLEARRANLAQEHLKKSELSETGRHNLVSENLQRMSLDETARSNMARENESRRANLAREAETHRSNLVTEGFQRQTVAEAKRANLARETIQRGQLAETVRSNQARELETNRSNIAREFETHRSNVAHESELRRSNMAREAETKRSNLAHEDLTRQTIGETARHNKVQEGVDIGRAATYGADVAARALWYRQKPASTYVNVHAPSVNRVPLGGAVSNSSPTNVERNVSTNVKQSSRSQRQGEFGGKKAKQEPEQKKWFELLNEGTNRLLFGYAGGFPELLNEASKKLR